MSEQSNTILEVDGLETRYSTDDGDIHAVDGVNFTVDKKETLGLVGESGCGKTTTAKSIIRLLAKNGEVESGRVELKGQDITELSDEELRKQIRWKEVSMIPQAAMNAFDPVKTVGRQLVDVIHRHESDTSSAAAWDRARDLFERLGIEADRVNDYPHQFSGGMAQRAVIAMALTLSPSLILADEPTTALDVVIQEQILQQIGDLQEEFETAMILITHDVSVVSETCDSVAVMYGGRVAEYGERVPQSRTGRPGPSVDPGQSTGPQRSGRRMSVRTALPVRAGGVLGGDTGARRVRRRPLR
jgi:peptide/nickel transport system ATP-binding protein